MNNLNKSKNHITPSNAVYSIMFGIVLAAFTPMLSAAPNDPVAVESRTDDRLSEVETPFQAPIESEQPEALSGIESQFQQQLLQQEVEALRGLVEELANEIKRLKQTGDDRYLELDGRFQALLEEVSSDSAPVVVKPQVLPVENEAVSSTNEPQITGSVVSGQSEKALYDTSLELIRNRQYDLAITQLQAVITQYPDGNYAANAYYWLGEVHAAKPQPDYESARQALVQVITFFPDNRKVPDAAFKLGKIYHLMGDCGRAGQLLNQIIEQHPGRSVAKLADTYLRNKMANCEAE